MASSLFERLRDNVSHIRQVIARQVLLPDLAGDASRVMCQQVADDGAWTSGYGLMCALSAGIATLGLLQSSVAVVIGAMIISPLMAPIAALGFGFASLDGRRIRDAARVVAIGAAIGIFTSLLITWVSPIRNATAEIISRTQPTLLDLAIALLSGLAGGYATVRKAGGTAIGVAIATALMPPLATVGYGLGTLRPDYAGGAFLLFLTNLAAIAFSFALIARLSGAASPLSHAKMSPTYIAAGAVIFLALATPLALTLVRVSHEDTARTAARRDIIKMLDVRDQDIAQLDAHWPLFGLPQVSAVVIAPRFAVGAQADLSASLTRQLGARTKVLLQQVVAGNVQSRAQAMIDAAIDRNAAGVADDIPPVAQIRAALPLPVQSLWVDQADHAVDIIPVAAPAWGLGDFRRMETAAQGNSDDSGDGWKVRVIPPPQADLVVPVSFDAQGNPRIAANDRDIAVWAIDRWAVKTLGLAALVGASPGTTRGNQAARAIGFVQNMLKIQGISTTIVGNKPAPAPRRPAPSQGGQGVGVDVIVFGNPPQPAGPAPTACGRAASPKCPGQPGGT